uniref:Tetraspanin n=1 Tax=Scophthalmus maximus TaxID=52904 RepID=A0A8D3C748_SCOMX
MKLELKIQLLRFCSVLLNAIFLVLGLSVISCGIWVLFDKGSFLTILSSVELRTVAMGLLMIGGVVTAVSVVGCVGADGEHRLLLLIYLGFLVILVLGQLFVTLLLLLNRNKVRTQNRSIKNLKRTTGCDWLIDCCQGKCCGRMGPADWLKNSHILSLNLTGPHILPCSCFRSFHAGVNSSWCYEQLNVMRPLYGPGNSSYVQGCKQTLSDWLQENAVTVVAMVVGLLLVQVNINII